LQADGETYALTLCDGVLIRHVLVLRAVKTSGRRGKHFVINNTHLKEAETIQQVWTQQPRAKKAQMSLRVSVVYAQTCLLHAANPSPVILSGSQQNFLVCVP